MKFLSPVIFLLAASAGSCLALTDKAKEAVKDLESAIAAEVKARKPDEGTSGERGHREQYDRQMMQQLRYYLNSPEAQRSDEVLSQLAAAYSSEDVQKLITLLREEITAERDAREQAARREINQALKSAGEAVRGAKGPADLDEAITELEKHLRRSQHSGSQELQELYSQIQPAHQFVTQWQSYLSAKNSGDSQQAMQSLQSLSGTPGASFLPRSEILALIQAARDRESAMASDSMSYLEKVLADTKTPDDIENTLKRLRALQLKNQNDPTLRDNLSGVIQSLISLNQSHQNFKAGLASNIDIVQSHSPSGADGGHVARLRSAILLAMLPRYVGAGEDVKAQPQETVFSFLNRLIDEAKLRGDVVVSMRSRQALELLQRGGSFSQTDQLGLGAFVSGQNQETAGQFMPAVISYQNALKSGSDLVPSKLIGTRLDAIKAAHPEDYAAGMEQFLNPPSPRYSGPDFSPGNRYGRDPRGEQQRIGLLIPPVKVATKSADAEDPAASKPASTVTPGPTSAAKPSPPPAPAK